MMREGLRLQADRIKRVTGVSPITKEEALEFLMWLHDFIEAHDIKQLEVRLKESHCGFNFNLTIDNEGIVLWVPASSGYSISEFCFSPLQIKSKGEIAEEDFEGLLSFLSYFESDSYSFIIRKLN